MSLSLAPGALYGFTHPRPPTTVGPSPGPSAPPQSDRAEGPQSLRARRSEEYVAALRELKSQQQDMRHTQATRTYLDIAHFDGGLQLIDVYA